MFRPKKIGKTLHKRHLTNFQRINGRKSHTHQNWISLGFAEPEFGRLFLLRWYYLLYLWEPLVMKWAVSIWLWRDRYGWKLILFISIFGWSTRACLDAIYITQAVGTNKFHIFTKQSILSPSPPRDSLPDALHWCCEYSSWTQDGLRQGSNRFPSLKLMWTRMSITVWPINSSDVKISSKTSEKQRYQKTLSRGCST